MTKKPLLYIHAGYAKCGSSTIQEFLAANVARFQREGLGIVGHKMTLDHSGRAVDFPVGYFEKLLRKPEQDRRQSLAAGLETLHTEILDAGLDGAILSAENLGQLRTAILFEGLLDVFEPRVIMYVRRQDDWILSAWKQWHFKEGSKLDRHIERHLQKNVPLFRRALKGWHDLIGRERMHVQYLKRECLTGGDLLTDFTTATGFDIAEFERVEDANISLPDDVIAILSEAPAMYEGLHDNRVLSFLKTTADILKPDGTDGLGAEARKRILAAYREENSWLHETFFQGKPFKDWLAVKNTPKTPTDRLSGLTKLVLLQTEALVRMRADIAALQKQLDDEQTKSKPQG
ncbi:hypothetical protein [Eilatimonas milleporae]|uniref:hypothetical protein n=1 Tax=Eilatimonas milleporae TaxID=911205 RepID=UPI0011C40A34|nr:hypothetical protein [Eilatimonas milleporae]